MLLFYIFKYIFIEINRHFFINFKLCLFLSLSSITDVRYPLQRYVNITLNDINDIICYVEKTDNFACSYFWKFESVDGNTSIINNSILTRNDIQSPGLYTCTAICQFGTSKECNITAIELSIISTESSKSYEGKYFLLKTS